MTAPGASGNPKVVTVTQAAPDMRVLKVQPESRNVDADARTATFDVSNAGAGTMSWSVQVMDGGSWLSITSGSSGTNAGTITVAYAANPGTTVRVGSVTVTASGASGSPKVVTVNQAGKTAYRLVVNVPKGHIQKRVIIDMDPTFGTGITSRDPDDILALICAAQTVNCHLEGVTVGWGNMWDVRSAGTPILPLFPLPEVADYHAVAVNARATLTAARQLPYHVDVLDGAEESQTWRRLGIDPTLDSSRWPTLPPETGASRFIKNKVKANPGQITIIAQGTLTNLATAMYHYDPSPCAFVQDVAEVWISGGAVEQNHDPWCSPGNVLPTMRAEFNIWRDPQAAEYVFRSICSSEKFKMAPLDASMDVAVTEKQWQEQVEKYEPTSQIAGYVGPVVHSWLEKPPNGLPGDVLAYFSNVFANKMYPFDTIGVALALDQCRKEAPLPYKIRVDLSGDDVGSTLKAPGVTDRGEVLVFEDFNVDVFRTYFFERMHGVDRGAWRPGVVYPGGGSEVA